MGSVEDSSRVQLGGTTEPLGNLSVHRAWYEIASAAAGFPLQWYSNDYPSAMTWDSSVAGLLVVFAILARDSNGSLVQSSATWLYVKGNWTPSNSSVEPTEPYGQLADYPPGNETIYVGPGATWGYRQGNWSRLNGTPGVGGYGTSVAYDPADRELVAYGGEDLTTFNSTNATWTWAPATGWSQLSPTSNPGARESAALGYDAGFGALLLFGGVFNAFTYPPERPFNDTWEFDQGNWTELSVRSGPPALWGASLAYSPAGNRTVLAGGWGIQSGWPALNYGSWSYGGGSWMEENQTQIWDPDGPVVVTYDPIVAAPVYISVAGFIGSGPTFRVDEYAWMAPSASVDAGRATVDVGQNVTFVARATLPGLLSSAASSWKWEGGSMNCTSQSAGWLECLAGSPGLERITFTLTDRSGGSVRGAFNFTVLPYPSIEPPLASARWADVGETIRFASIVYGGQAPFHYWWSPNGLAKCGPSDRTDFTCIFRAVGLSSVQLAVRDANGAFAGPVDSRRLIVYPALVPGIPQSSETYGIAPGWVTFTASVIGGNTSSGYTFRWLSSLIDCRTLSLTTIDCPTGVPGVFPIQFSVSDDHGNYSLDSPLLNFTVVGPLTVAPMQVTPAVIDLGQSVTFSTTLYGAPPTPMFVLWAGLPPGCGPGPVSGNTCTPQEAGVYHVFLLVEDENGRSAHSLAATLAVAPPLVAPSLLPSSSEVVAGEPFSLLLTEPGGTPPLVVSFPGLPTGCRPVQSIALNCTIPAAGTYTVSVNVRDAVGAQANLSYALHVAPAPPAGSAAPTAPGPPIGILAGLAGATVVAAGILIAGLLRARRHPSGRAKRVPPLGRGRRDGVPSLR